MGQILWHLSLWWTSWNRENRARENKNLLHFVLCRLQWCMSHLSMTDLNKYTWLLAVLLHCKHLLFVFFPQTYAPCIFIPKHKSVLWKWNKCALSQEVEIMLCWSWKYIECWMASISPHFPITTSLSWSVAKKQLTDRRWQASDDSVWWQCVCGLMAASSRRLI